MHQRRQFRSGNYHAGAMAISIGTQIVEVPAPNVCLLGWRVLVSRSVDAYNYLKKPKDLQSNLKANFERTNQARVFPAFPDVCKSRGTI